MKMVRKSGEGSPCSTYIHPFYFSFGEAQRCHRLLTEPCGVLRPIEQRSSTPRRNQGKKSERADAETKRQRKGRSILSAISYSCELLLIYARCELVLTSGGRTCFTLQSVARRDCLPTGASMPRYETPVSQLCPRCKFSPFGPIDGNPGPPEDARNTAISG